MSIWGCRLCLAILVLSGIALGRFTIPVDGGEVVQALAVEGSTLYIASDYDGSPPYALGAYDRTTGKLMRQIAVPAMPAALQVGPGGRIWLTFSPDQGGGPVGTWLLGADLRRRSSSEITGPNALLPIGSNTALFATQGGLEILHMPSPGVPGRATLRREPSTSIGKPAQSAPNFFARLAGRVAVQVTDGYGFHSHLVLAGRPSVTFGGSSRQQVGYVVASGKAFWVTTSRSGAQTGPLVRLNDRLQVTTPRSLRSNSILGQAEEVWSVGNTVWVSTASAGHHLVCFSDRNEIGPVATVPVRGQPIALAASGDTVYVADAVQFGPAQTSNVVTYSVPAACR